MHQLQLGHVAASLSFTSILALIPTFAVLFAIFTAFPAFQAMRTTLEAYLLKSLMPPAIAHQILEYLNLFALKAKKISLFGGITLLLTVLFMLSTIEKVFDRIWGVARPRPLSRRLIIYWTLITVGPVLLGLLFLSGGWLVDWVGWDGKSSTGGNSWGQSLIGIGLLTALFSALYFLVPNRFVLARHALVGGLVAGVLVEAMRVLFSFYVAHSQNYTMVYGTLAAIPILLIWLDIFWLVVLLGAIITAYLPEREYENLQVNEASRLFFDAADLLAQLAQARASQANALVSQEQLSHTTQLPPHQVEFILKKLAAQQWVGMQLRHQKLGRFRHKNIQEWALLANPEQLRLSEVYRLTVPLPPQHSLADTLEAHITKALQLTLAQWIARPTVAR